LESGNGNGNNLFLGKFLRVKGGEYGATTGRPRRTGWLDLPLLHYVIQTSGQKNLILTKLDILDSLNEIDPDSYIKVCYAYRYIGEAPYYYGDKIIQKNDPVKVAIPDANFLAQCEPVYDSFRVWDEGISDIREIRDAPPNLMALISYLEREVGVTIKALSVGPRPEQTILL
jgi:adenylosuccinate synthase